MQYALYIHTVICLCGIQRPTHISPCTTFSLTHTASLFYLLICQSVPPSCLRGCASGQSPRAASTHLHSSCRPLLVSSRTVASLLLLKVFSFWKELKKNISVCSFVCYYSWVKTYSMTHVYDFLICGQCSSCLYELISILQEVLQFSFVFYFT